MKRLCPGLTAALFVMLATAVTASDSPSEAEREGQQLAQQLLEQSPAEATTLSGVLSIRGIGPGQLKIPVKFQLMVTATNWQAIYQTVSNSVRPVITRLVITHDGAKGNHYELNGSTVAPTDTAVPFAGSDFWLCDLGLEFLHWPEQKVLKKELRRSRFCTVLESTNPNPGNGNYTRVVSWIDKETDGIVHAEAYEGSQRVKVFDPKEFKKVNGQWQLEEMQMRNDETGSRTRIEFDLKKE